MGQHSFDIACKINEQELINAIHQAEKDVSFRFDLKDTDSKITFQPKEFTIQLESEDDYKVKAVLEILKQKMMKRGIPPSVITIDKADVSLGGRCKQYLQIQQGIPMEKAKEIVKEIKQTKLKVQAQIQGDQVRVTASKIDDLQAVIAHVKSKKYDFHLDFLNYR